MKRNKKSLEDETELFHHRLKNTIPNSIKRFQWVRNNERIVDLDHKSLWPNVKRLYDEGRYCYCLGLFYASIFSIGSCIEAYYDQIIRYRFRDLIPELHTGDKGHFNVYNAIKKVRSRNAISEEVTERVIKFRTNIRNLATHQMAMMEPPLGYKEIKIGEYESDTLEDPLTPEDSAKEGLLCILQLFKEFDTWK